MLYLKFIQTLSFRGRRSRNKVSVGEPAEGSLDYIIEKKKKKKKKVILFFFYNKRLNS
jgi:hypothetical protein